NTENKASRWPGGCSIQAFLLVRLTIPIRIKRQETIRAMALVCGWLRACPAPMMAELRDQLFTGWLMLGFSIPIQSLLLQGLRTFGKRSRISCLIFSAITRDRLTFSIAHYSSTTAQLVPLRPRTLISRSS